MFAIAAKIQTPSNGLSSRGIDRDSQPRDGSRSNTDQTGTKYIIRVHTRMELLGEHG